jgi:hypothetical protein
LCRNNLFKAQTFAGSRSLFDGSALSWAVSDKNLGGSDICAFEASPSGNLYIKIQVCADRTAGSFHAPPITEMFRNKISMCPLPVALYRPQNLRTDFSGRNDYTYDASVHDLSAKSFAENEEILGEEPELIN